MFGAPDIRPEGELLLLRELFYADLPGETHTLSSSYFDIEKGAHDVRTQPPKIDPSPEIAPDFRIRRTPSMVLLGRYCQ